MASPKLTLHTFFRSSSSARLRMALNLKGIAYTPLFVNILTNEHHTESYTKLNPLNTVPLLVHHTEEGTDVSIAQSLAALEYLEEAFPAIRPLLPPASDRAGRSFVRTLATTIVADVQPVTSLRVQAAIGEIGGDKTAWARKYMEIGFRSYERFLENEGSDGRVLLRRFHHHRRHLPDSPGVERRRDRHALGAVSEAEEGV